MEITRTIRHQALTDQGQGHSVTLKFLHWSTSISQLECWMSKLTELMNC